MNFLEDLVMDTNFKNKILKYEEDGTLERELPEIFKLRSIEQRNDYHPEGDALTHTIMVVEKLPFDLKMKLSGMFHDVGKGIKMHGHEHIGLGIIDDVFTRFNIDEETKTFVKYITRFHMRMHIFFDMRKFKQVDMMKDERFPYLITFAKADDMVGSDIPERIEKHYEEYLKDMKIGTES